MTPDLIQRYAKPIPRYTSYPTANHFSATTDNEHYRSWLTDLPQDATLSLYLHIPFCQELCWYCGCSTKAVRRYGPVADYLELLDREMTAVANLVPNQHGVTHIHWGGGSPDILKASDIIRLGTSMRERFNVLAHSEIAVEVDPRLLSAAQADSFITIGVNRVSIGVQDFDPQVQRAIGRLQSFETTRNAIDLFRQRGVDSINIDLVYGLPHQSLDSVARTVEQVLKLAPDRVSVFGYAHLPERLKHQRLIDTAALPGPMQRFEQSRGIATLLTTAGYIQRGLDHFARRDDNLAVKALARNFQGYTTDQADALLGLGASAISRLPQGYAQNAVPAGEYQRRIESDGLATARGHRVSSDDQIRAFVIERLMCDFEVSWSDLGRRFGVRASAIREEADDIVARDYDGLVDHTGDRFMLTARGRPFVRNICAEFDTYLAREVARRRHALSI